MQIIIDHNTSKEQMIAISNMLLALNGAVPMSTQELSLVPSNTQQSPTVIIPQQLPAHNNLHEAAAGSPSTISTAPITGAITERDAAGMRWDARIHSSTKSKKADGTWTIRRNTDPALIESVRAEHLAADPIRNLVADAADLPPDPAFMPPPPPVSPAAVFGGAAQPIDWIQVLTQVTNAKVNGRFNEQVSAGFLAHYQLAEFANLSVRPDLFAEYLRVVLS